MSFTISDLYSYLCIFLIYAFSGWVIEVIFHAARMGLIVNRGFLCGPVCPVYGIVGVIVHFLASDLLPLFPVTARISSGTRLSDLLLIYAAGVLLATLVELIAGWLMFHLFHTRWWDYSKEPFNLGGYICLRFSLLWGIAVLVVVRLVTPLLSAQKTITEPSQAGWVVILLLYVLFAADLLVSVSIAAGFQKRIHELDRLKKGLSRSGDFLSKHIGERALETQNRIASAQVQATLAGYELRDAVAEVPEKLASLRDAMPSPSEGAESLKETVSGGVGALKEAVSAGTESLKETVSGGAESFRGTVSEGVQSVRGTVSGGREDPEKQMSQLRARLSRGRVFGARRLLRAFPDLKIDVDEETLREVRQELKGSSAAEDAAKGGT